MSTNEHMTIPEHVATSLSLAPDVTSEELAAGAERMPFVMEVFGLSGEEFSVAVSKALTVTSNTEFSQSDRNVCSWRYMEMYNEGALEMRALQVPVDRQAAPPTAAAQLLVEAWLQNASLLDVEQSISPNTVIKCLKGDAKLLDFGSKFVRNWANVCSLMQGDAQPPLWIQNSQLIIEMGRLHSPNAEEKGVGYERLFLEATSEVKAKWRFLSLYRILEHGYISEIFKTLKTEFFRSPNESLERARKNVENEMQQFLALVKSATLDCHFDAICRRFDELKTSGNRFANAIQHSMDKGGKLPSSGRDASDKGVHVCYKIRCAIVHAGLAGPIFDAYDDASACVEGILCDCEAATLQFLGIRSEA